MLEKYSDDKKAIILDEIFNRYFNRNFGTMSKADFEVYLFHYYIEYLRENEPELCSDYALSNIMGITQSRVRNLKIKAELLYPREDFNNKWKEIFVGYIANANYQGGLVKMNIPEVDVLVELRHFMEENGWYDEYQLNPKLFQCPLEIFLKLCEKLDGEEIYISSEGCERLMKLKKNSESPDKNVIDTFLRGDIKGGLVKLGKNTTKEFIKLIPELIPGGIAVTEAIKLITKALVE